MDEMEYGNVHQGIIAFGEWKGFQYKVLNCRGMHPCGYVNVKGTKLDGEYYVDVPEIVNVHPHGGFTFSDSGVLPGEEDGWWLGWDYGHCGDYMYCETGYLIYDGKKWTTEEVVEHCKEVIDKIVEWIEKEGEKKE